MIDSLIALHCALGIALVGYTLARVAAEWWADQWYDADGSPHHCSECGSPYIGWHGSVYFCEDCGEDLGLRYVEGDWSQEWRAECIDGAMKVGRWIGPLLAVGVALVFIA